MRLEMSQKSEPVISGVAWRPRTRGVTGHSVGRTCPMDFIGLMCHSSRQRQNWRWTRGSDSSGKMAGRAKQAALASFEGESEIMRSRGLILIDTKYEFGLDRDGVLHVIDEVNTPDSSRLCDVEEGEENYSRVATAMATGRFNTVTAFLEVQPELKIEEFSEHHVRDALLDMGFNPAMDTEEPKLSDDTEIVEEALFGMEGLRPWLFPQPPVLESGALGFESQSESDPIR